MQNKRNLSADNKGIRRTSLRTRLLAGMLVLSLAVLVAVSYANYRVSAQALIDKISAESVKNAEYNAASLQFWVNQLQNTAKILADAIVLQEVLPEQQLAVLQEHLHDLPDVSYIVVADQSAWGRTTSGAEADVSDRDYFQQALAGQTVVSEYVIGKDNNRPQFMIATPIHKGAEIMGVLALAVDAEVMAEQISWLEFADTGFAMLLRKDGLVLAHPDRSLIMNANLAQDQEISAAIKTILGSTPSPSAKKSSVDAETRSTEQIVRSGVTFYTASGTRYIAVYSSFPFTDWVLVQVAPFAELTRGLAEQQKKLILVNLGAALLLAVAAAALATNIVRPLTALARGTMAVAEGDLTQIIKIQGRDEVGLLGANFNTMVQALRSLLSKVTAAADQVAGASDKLSVTAGQVSQAVEQVATSVQDIAHAADHQAQDVNTTAVEVDKFHQLVQTLAADTEDIAQSAEQVANTAGDGGKQAQAAKEQMQVIAKSTGELADLVNSLNDKARHVGLVTETIAGFAAETNLLALNAAIEAARAGEYGRGFAVVAEEIRKLSEQSQAAAGEITAILDDIQRGAVAAADAMERGGREVEQGTLTMERTAISFGEIGQAVEAINTRLQELAEAAGDLAQGAAEIDRATQNIAAGIEETSASTQEVAATSEEQTASMQEIAAAANDLAKLAAHLREEVAKFKV
ncbi:MAG: methyl-accepting chemotaxis protein [bacterium]